MYAVANVRKFLADRKDEISPKKAAAILKRACKQGRSNGVLMGGGSTDLWRDAKLEKRFARVLTRNARHVKIGLAALRSRKR